MIIYRCDKCGYELQKRGIVENMWKSHKFEQLRVPLPGDITDVCQTCFRDILRAKSRADNEERKSKRNRMLELLGFGDD